MKIFELEISGKKKRVWAEKIGSELWLHYDGETRLIPPPETKRRQGTSASTNDGALVAPMPGKIMKIQSKVGDQVQPQQVVIVMEAMKMEYSIESPIKGLLTDLKCNEGQQVALGEFLAQVKGEDT